MTWKWPTQLRQVGRKVRKLYRKLLTSAKKQLSHLLCCFLHFLHLNFCFSWPFEFVMFVNGKRNSYWNQKTTVFAYIFEESQKCKLWILTIVSCRIFSMRARISHPLIYVILFITIKPTLNTHFPPHIHITCREKSEARNQRSTSTIIQ